MLGIQVQIYVHRFHRFQTLSVLIFGIVLMTNVGIEGVVQSQECLANCFARPDHGFQNSDGYSTDDRTNRPLRGGQLDRV